MSALWDSGCTGGMAGCVCARVHVDVLGGAGDRCISEGKPCGKRASHDEWSTEGRVGEARATRWWAHWVPGSHIEYQVLAAPVKRSGPPLLDDTRVQSTLE